MTISLIITGSLCILMGIITLWSYLTHPLTEYGMTQYNGKMFWFFSLLCFISIYLKG